MLFFQPTPTPVPLNQINQTVEHALSSLDVATQQGAIGVLLLFGIIGVILAAWLLLKTYINRNKKDGNGIFAQILASQQQQIEAADKERRSNQERMERVAAETESRYIKFATGYSEALKYWADQIKAQAEQIKTQTIINERVSETLEALSIRESNQDGKINTIHESINDVRQALNILGARIDKLIPEHVATLDTATMEMRTVAASVNAALEALKKKRADTQPLPVITPHMLDSASDGKPSTPPPSHSAD